MSEGTEISKFPRKKISMQGHAIARIFQVVTEENHIRRE